MFGLDNCMTCDRFHEREWGTFRWSGWGCKNVKNSAPCPLHSTIPLGAASAISRLRRRRGWGWGGGGGKDRVREKKNCRSMTVVLASGGVLQIWEWFMQMLCWKRAVLCIDGRKRKKKSVILCTKKELTRCDRKIAQKTEKHGIVCNGFYSVKLRHHGQFSESEEIVCPVLLLLLGRNFRDRTHNGPISEVAKGL